MEPVRISTSLPPVVKPELCDAQAEVPNSSVNSEAQSKSTSSSSEGTVFQTGTGDEVLVAFEHGDQRMPFLTGGLWNADTPPTSAPPVDGAGGSGATQPGTGAAENATGHKDATLHDEVTAHHLRKLK
jgi:hypothetical protein